MSRREASLVSVLLFSGGICSVRIDDLHLAIAPVLLGAGEHLLGGLNLPALGYECVERIEGARATHVTLSKRV